MKKLFLFITFLPILAHSQTSNVPREQSRVNNMNELMRSNTSSLMLYYEPSELDIKGSRFYHKDYTDGELWFVNGEYIGKEYQYRFDEQQKTVQVKDKNGEETLVDPTKINGCRLKIDGKSVLYFRASLPVDINKKHLFQLLYNSDKYNVIKLPSKKLIPKTKMFHNDEQQYEYINEHRYFIKKGDGEFQEFKLKKKEIIKVFPEKKRILEKLFETKPYDERLSESLLAQLLVQLEK